MRNLFFVAAGLGLLYFFSNQEKDNRPQTDPNAQKKTLDETKTDETEETSHSGPIVSPPPPAVGQIQM